MKTLFNSLMLTIFCSLIGQVALRAQDGYGGHWFLGLNGGAAWQQSDVKSILGGGTGFYVGKNVLYSPTAPLSFDLRFRYLYTATMGQDFKTTNVTNNSTLNSNYSFVYHNHRTGFNDLALEGRINFENLRRKNKIWLSLYGGAGLGIYGVRYDQLEGNLVTGTPYNNLYNTISSDPTLTKDEIISQILQNRDGEYETPMHGQFSNNLRATFTPNVGIELGYWITKNFALGVGHRVNWTFKDDFDGVIRGNGNNIHHYANLFMHFKISGNASGEVIRNNDHINTPGVERPTVDITTPNQSPFTVTGGTTRIACNIRNVETRSGVMMYVNNIAVDNYSFNPGTDILDAFVSLNIGANTVRITGTNAAGTAEDNVTIIYQQNVVNPPNPPIVNTTSNPPTVNITQPTANPYSTQNASENIRATITNVAGMNNVTFTVNGQNIRNFTLTGTSFNASGIALQQGTNSIVISASNNDGNASDQVTINYQTTNAAAQPTVNITQPSANPFTSASSTANIRATITNVPSRSNVNFFVNGQPQSNFSFSGTSFNANNIALQQGSNNILISASNQDGTASDQTVINYQPVRTATPPTVVITNPTANPLNIQVASQSINATITNVSSAANVSFTINGVANNNFTLNGTSFTANNINFSRGTSTVIITANNQDGTASDQTVINYQATRIPTPPTVTITNPTANPLNIQVAGQNINATITNVSNAANVSFTVNGVPNTNFTLNGTSFTANNVIFGQGSNTVVISASNQDGTASDQTVINYQPVKETLPPTVTITNPTANPLNTQSATQNISATITNVRRAANVTFTINGVANTNFTFSGTSFTASNVTLNQSANNIVITASNTDGTASDQTVINYQPVSTPKPPTVIITNPANEVSNSGVANVTINSTILNVNNASGVTFTVNGQQNNNFTLSGTSFSANNVQLNEGSNNIVIRATNQDGNASDNASITYTKPQDVRIPTPPTVVITNPSTEPFTTNNATAVINATITNVSNAQNVTFTVNGQNVRNFSLSGTSFSASGINLNPGNNTFVVSATNKDGNVSDNATIVYNAPVQPPVVTITTPSTNPYNSSTNTTSIRATILNVANAQGVSFMVNGQYVTNFTFTGTSFSASNLPLNSGSNNFTITGTNSAGSDVKSTVVSYSPQPAPSIGDMSVAVQPATTGCTVTVYAGLSNVSNINQITFKINGVVTSGFTFQNNVFNYSYNVTSNNPSTINYEITVNNGGGTATQTRSANVANCSVQAPPDVRNGNVQISMQNGSCIATITAQLVNVDNNSQIRFTANGRNTNFTNTNGSFTATVDLTGVTSSSISFVISATTAAGSDSETITGNLNNCVSRPVITNMRATQLQVRGAFFATVTANISGVTNSNQIIFTVNGVSSTDFTFVNGVFTATEIPVNPGRNTFNITAANAAGSVSDSKELTVSGNTGGQQNGTNNSTNTINGNPVNNDGGNNNNGSNNGGGNRPVDNTDKGKDGKGNKTSTEKPAEKPAENKTEVKTETKTNKISTDKPAEVKPEEKTNKGGKLGTDKKEGGK